VTKDAATHLQKIMHVWMADMIVQNIETKNKFCLFGKILIFIFSFFISFWQNLNLKLTDGFMKLNHYNIIHFQVYFKGPKISGPCAQSAA